MVETMPSRYSTPRPDIPEALAPSPPGPTHGLATLRTIAALILREMSTRYGRTPGGYIWGVLEPLAAIMVLSIGFSLLIHSPSLGTSFLLFYSTGYLPFNLYQSISLTTARALSFSRPLLRYPTVTWADAVLARFILNSLTGLLVTILLISGILMFEKHRAILDIPAILEALGLAMMVGLGIGTVNCVLMGLYPLWELVWSVITRPLFIASGVMFLFEDLPQSVQNILWYNPLMHISGLMRDGFYPTYTASYVSVTYVLLTSMSLLALGLILMSRYHRVILNR